MDPLPRTRRSGYKTQQRLNGDDQYSIRMNHLQFVFFIILLAVVHEVCCSHHHHAGSHHHRNHHRHRYSKSRSMELAEQEHADLMFQGKGLSLMDYIVLEMNATEPTSATCTKYKQKVIDYCTSMFHAHSRSRTITEEYHDLFIEHPSISMTFPRGVCCAFQRFYLKCVGPAINYVCKPEEFNSVFDHVGGLSNYCERLFGKRIKNCPKPPEPKSSLEDVPDSQPVRPAARALHPEIQFEEDIHGTLHAQPLQSTNDLVENLLYSQFDTSNPNEEDYDYVDI